MYKPFTEKDIDTAIRELGVDVPGVESAGFMGGEEWFVIKAGNFITYTRLGGVIEFDRVLRKKAKEYVAKI